MKIRRTVSFEKWFKALKDSIGKALIIKRIDRLSDGNSGDVKPVGEGVSEMRIDYGPGYRVYFTQRRLEIIILLCGGDKSTQSRDIEKAKKLAKEI
jgi:putative addiction module killer protein